MKLAQNHFLYFVFILKFSIFRVRQITGPNNRQMMSMNLTIHTKINKLLDFRFRNLFAGMTIRGGPAFPLANLKFFENINNMIY